MLRDIEQGDKLELIGKQGNFYQVKKRIGFDSELTGFVDEKVIKVVEEKPMSYKIRRIVASLNGQIFTKPDISSITLAEVQEGDKLTILDETEDFYHVKLDANNKIAGYIEKELFAKHLVVALKGNIFVEPNINSEAVCEVFKDDKLIILSEADKFYHVKLESDRSVSGYIVKELLIIPILQAPFEQVKKSDISQESLYTKQDNTANMTSADNQENSSVEIKITGIKRIFSSEINSGTVQGCIIGLLLFFSAYLPWMNVHASIFGDTSSYSPSGRQFPIYGGMVMGLGIFCAICSFFADEKRRGGVFIFLGGVSAIVILAFLINFHSLLLQFMVYADSYSNASQGIGMWVSLIGTIWAIIFGITKLRKISKQEYTSFK